MKQLLALFVFILLTLLTAAQDCNYNYKSGTLLTPKELVRTSEDKLDLTIDNSAYYNCLQLTTDTIKTYWLNNAIARNLTYLNKPIDSIKKHVKQAYLANQSKFCKEYVYEFFKVNYDSTYPMQPHYLDQLDDQELNQIKEQCQNDYLEIEKEKRANNDNRKKAQIQNEKFNRAYFEELRKIAEDEQLERKKKTINWTIQNSLDSINRIKLDSLYNLYGFPSQEKVTDEGTIKAFMVMHHSTNCVWNEKWTKRFLQYHDQIKVEKLFSFYFYRNFNNNDGICKENILFIEKIRNGTYSKIGKDLLDFSEWEKRFSKNK